MLPSQSTLCSNTQELLLLQENKKNNKPRLKFCHPSSDATGHKRGKEESEWVLPEQGARLRSSPPPSDWWPNPTLGNHVETCLTIYTAVLLLFY